MIEYRRATAADADDLAHIRSVFLAGLNDVCTETERQAVEDAGKIYFRAALTNGTFIAWIALHEERIVATSGLVSYGVPPSMNCMNGKTAYIMNMYTRPDYRNQGIATELFKRIVEEAKAIGCAKITLNATSMGRPLYEAYGFGDVENDMVYHAE